MRTSRFILFLLFMFTICNSYGYQIKDNFSDTSFYKNVRYKKLNKFVAYHVIKEGKYSNSPRLVYTFQMIAVYHYYNHSYESVEDDHAVKGKSVEIRKLILSDQFDNKKDLDVIFKINSKIAFVEKPNLLRMIDVFPKENNVKSVGLLVSELNREDFVSSLSLDTIKDNPFDKLMPTRKKDVCIKIRLKAKYWNLESLDVLSKKLKKWPDVSNAEYVQFFTGISESDDFFEITSTTQSVSAIEVSKKANDEKKKKDPFKAFVDSLEKKH